MTTDPMIGKSFPDFDLPVTGGGTLSRADLAGGPAVLFFYPRDDTSGCTKEAIGFTAAESDFAGLKAQVIGVSKDSLSSHEKFAAKHGLTVPLLSDETGNLCEDCGVWQDKQMYGRTFKGIVRSTFLLDGDGIVRQVWRKVKVPGHVEDVLAAVKAL
ncbi:peroxiredoxin [Oceanomicrobium pacificus]|uniref:thioredoxin-dependent peroxiredoxin n=1 Tax=Oceanomicrobium pacificus TaxID=2692916 RepID=A0A6B0U4B4_9RHOB|nr:peroxiredoxin [Oceanomicrobium pacificus]MXU65781.1 redoxin domain-containing protein [Oceanomicrobium pacificus]